MADMPKELKDGDIVEIVLRGRVSNVTHDGKQGPRLTVTAVGRELEGDNPGYANGIYLQDEHVASVKVITPETSGGSVSAMMVECNDDACTRKHHGRTYRMHLELIER